MKHDNGAAIQKYLLAGLLSMNLVPLLPGQTESTTAADAEIEAKVRKTLADKPAFTGALIAPSVSGGVVTLTGNVSSGGQKTLVSSELAHVSGVRSVQNNLYVVGGDGHGQVATPAAVPVEANGPKSVTVPAGTAIPIRLSSEISTKTAKIGDTFRGTVASNVQQGGYTVIATGTAVTGAVMNAKSGGRFSGSASLSIQLVSARLRTGSGIQDVSLATQPLSDEAPGKGGSTAARSGVGAALGGLLGAVTGGGTGAVVGGVGGGAAGAASSGITRGKQIDLKPEQLFQFTTSAPLEVTVVLRNGQQVQGSDASDPALQTRPGSPAQR